MTATKQGHCKHGVPLREMTCMQCTYELSIFAEDDNQSVLREIVAAAPEHEARRRRFVIEQELEIRRREQQA